MVSSSRRVDTTPGPMGIDGGAEVCLVEALVCSCKFCAIFWMEQSLLTGSRERSFSNVELFLRACNLQRDIKVLITMK